MFTVKFSVENIQINFSLISWVFINIPKALALAISFK